MTSRQNSHETHAENGKTHADSNNVVFYQIKLVWYKLQHKKSILVCIRFELLILWLITLQFSPLGILRMIVYFIYLANGMELTHFVEENSLNEGKCRIWTHCTLAFSTSLIPLVWLMPLSQPCNFGYSKLLH